jgi:hypothetical protein
MKHWVAAKIAVPVVPVAAIITQVRAVLIQVQPLAQSQVVLIPATQNQVALILATQSQVVLILATQNPAAQALAPDTFSILRSASMVAVGMDLTGIILIS